MKENVYKVKENEDITFTIPFTGTPKPEAEWVTSGTVVKSTPRTKKTLGEDSATLTIKKAIDKDAGEYTIKLTNPVGDAEASLTLIILSKYLIEFSASKMVFVYADDGEKMVIDFLMNLLIHFQNHHLRLANLSHWM